MPQYDTLTIEKILEFLNNHPVCFDYFPHDHKEIVRLPKQWIVNVAATVIGTPFRDWVKEQVKNRNHSMAVTKNLFVEMDPDIYQAFSNSNAVSSKCSQLYCYTDR